jgi:hypothetical protein
MLLTLTAVCYGMQETNALPFPGVAGGWNRRKGLGRREEGAYQQGSPQYFTTTDNRQGASGVGKALQRKAPGTCTDTDTVRA